MDLRVENVTGENPQASAYGVYLDAGETETPLRVGTIAAFGIPEASRSDETHDGTGVTDAFDITDAVRSSTAGASGTRRPRGSRFARSTPTGTPRRAATSGRVASASIAADVVAATRPLLPAPSVDGLPLGATGLVAARGRSRRVDDLPRRDDRLAGYLERAYASRRLRRAIGPSGRRGSAWWLLMVAAMMMPLAMRDARWLAHRSLARRRGRTVALHVLGFLLVWTGLGAVVAAAASTIGLGTRAAAVSLAAAAVWHVSPVRRRVLGRCGPAGLRNTWAARRYRLCAGRNQNRAVVPHHVWRFPWSRWARHTASP